MFPTLQELCDLNEQQALDSLHDEAASIGLRPSEINGRHLSDVETATAFAHLAELLVQYMADKNIGPEPVSEPVVA